MNPPRKKPNLKPLIRSDEDLDRLSEITIDDIEAAQNWQAVSRNKTAAALLNAEVEDNGEPDPAL